MYRITWLSRAVKQLGKLPVRDNQTVRRAVDKLSVSPQVPGVKKLASHEFSYRLRVGRYRVLFDADKEICIITIQEVKKRDDRTY
jgi:mRNA-degrading endonuclease RelE of RelBE toxin-antitoxin system